MSAYTSKPWAVHPLRPMAVHQPEFQCWIPQNKADARLIAAAPDLLEALKVFVDNGGIGSEDMFDDARAAIAKAEVL